MGSYSKEEAVDTDVGVVDGVAVEGRRVESVVADHQFILVCANEEVVP
jgi:hypothetical protein